MKYYQVLLNEFMQFFIDDETIAASMSSQLQITSLRIDLVNIEDMQNHNIHYC